MPSKSLLYMERISKSFPGVQALRSVDFELFQGEVHALVGENGAGKSTLIKILAGVYRPDGGCVWLQGRQIHARSPRDMMDVGVRVIYQELNLVPTLSVAENLFLGREPIRRGTFGLVNWREMYRQSEEILDRFGLRVDPQIQVGRLGVAYQQIIEIAKAISCDAQVLVMDEPTAALTPRETEKLLTIIHSLRKQQVSIIFVSHRLDEIRQIADRVTVLRDGQRVITASQADLPADRIIRHMVGRSMEEVYPKEEIAKGDILLEVKGLSRRGVCQDVSFQLRRGEILGMAGLVGAGRTEIAELLFGRRKPDHGTIRIAGEPVRVRSPRHAVAHGIGLIPEDRKTDGLVLQMSVFDNATLSILKGHSICGIVRRKSLFRLVEKVTQGMQLKAASLTQQVKYLSGGNQQKVVLARWLLHDCQIYIFDEPTRGVDVGAKSEIYRLMEDLARRGAGIIMISSDMPEVLNMSDRILVVRAGQIAGQLQRHEATQESVLRLAVGQAGVEP